MKSTTQMCATAAGLALIGFVLVGCSTPSDAKKSDSASATQKSAAAGPSGATMWVQNCGHCHNLRSPDSYSDAQWEVAMLHMRLRANLTAEEHRKILTFLKSAH